MKTFNKQLECVYSKTNLLEIIWGSKISNHTRIRCMSTFYIMNIVISKIKLGLIHYWLCLI